MNRTLDTELIFVFPENNKFREVQPELFYAEFYGLFDGYGMMFDPAVIAITGSIPEYANGFPANPPPGAVFICGSSKIDYDKNNPGNFSGVFIDKKGGRLSEKEALQFEQLETFYPAGLRFTTYEDKPSVAWSISDRPVVKQCGNAVWLGIEFFCILDQLREDIPEERLIMLADQFADLLSKTIFSATEHQSLSLKATDLRLDCQAYGVNRLLLRWLSKEFAENISFTEADNYYLAAVRLIADHDHVMAEQQLLLAFQRLSQLRYSICDMQIKFLEIPHIGILFEDEGFFEFEWPEFTRQRIEKLLDFCDNGCCKISFEAGGACWKHFAARFPQTIERLNKMIVAGKAAVTNGTYSLPYALYSPTGMQYWQFEQGLKEHTAIFTAETPVYQCQENSFTPLMPQLLNHFNYKSALHVVQNRGKSPTVDQQFFTWRGADNSRLPVMAVPNEELGRKGCNYFYDLPLIMKKYSDLPVIYYPNFQDIGFIPLRAHIYRATRYAAIWGEFILPEDLPILEEASNHTLSFEPEEYCLAENAFYNNMTAINTLSQLERIFDQYNQLCLLQYASYMAGEDQFYLNSMIQGLLSQEAHDVIACQGQRIGDFYGQCTLLSPPRKRRSLQNKMDELNAEFHAEATRLSNKLISSTDEPSGLLNPGACDLPFAKIAFANNYSSDAVIKLGEYAYANGVFNAGEVSYPSAFKPVPDTLPLQFGKWNVVLDGDYLHAEYDGKCFDLKVIDHKRGDFTLNSASVRKSDELAVITVDFSFEINSAPIHSVTLNLLLSPNAPLLETVVVYSTTKEFIFSDKWEDYLGIVIKADSALGALTHCTPGYRTTAYKARIVSSYFIKTDNGITLLNAGAPYYEKLNEYELVWMFHNYAERESCRRMAIDLGDTDPMLMSSCWSRGVMPYSKKIARTISIPKEFQSENFVADNKLLACCIEDVDSAGIDNIQLLGHDKLPKRIIAGTLVIFTF